MATQGNRSWDTAIGHRFHPNHQILKKYMRHGDWLTSLTALAPECHLLRTLEAGTLFFWRQMGEDQVFRVWQGDQTKLELPNLHFSPLQFCCQ